MKQYQMFELQYQGEEPEGSYVYVDLYADFTVDDQTVRVKGFYAGDRVYKIRFYPAKTGRYHIEVNGIIQDSRDEICESSEAHGMVRADGTHFKYEDGSWYYPFGTTVYGLVHQTKELIDQTMDTLAHAPFNKIRFCAFPKNYDYNHNDPDFYAFEGDSHNWDTKHPSFAYWDHLDTRIQQLNDLEIQGDLILFHLYDRWGFADLDTAQRKDYLEYLLRRLSAYPNLWWSMANEYDIMKWTFEYWKEIEEYIHDHDPYGHLLSNHQMVEPWDFDRKNITHICTQIKNVDNIKFDIRVHQKPMMVDECRYEGNIQYEWGNISGFEMVNRFWKVMLQGGYCTHGETFFSEDEILWWSKGGILKGQSPARIQFLRDLVESFPGPIDYADNVLTIESVKEAIAHPTERTRQSPLWDLMNRVSPEAILLLVNGMAGFQGKCGDQVLIKYYETQCTALGEMMLPENGVYDVDIVDVWEMTRTRALSGVSGKVHITLPGKEGMALLAVKADV